MEIGALARWPNSCRLDLSEGVQRFIAGWSSPVARQAHNLKVIGSNPIPATKFEALENVMFSRAFCCLKFWAPRSEAIWKRAWIVTVWWPGVSSLTAAIVRTKLQPRRDVHS